MENKKKTVKVAAPATRKQVKPVIDNPLFTKENYMWMLGGLALIMLGFFLMAGGKSQDPNIFKDNDVYSTTRITIAPLLIVGGLIVEIFAIMKNPTKVKYPVQNKRAEDTGNIGSI